MDQSAYTSLSPIEHVLTVPEFYLGSSSHTPREEWLFDGEKMHPCKITFPSACARLFLEIVTNASDNVFRSRSFGTEPGVIDVTVTDTQVTVKNWGEPIPIAIHEETGMYVPQLIFGVLHSGSSYTDERQGAGRYGVGGKAANIFSTLFSVVINDATGHKSYSQQWRDNMAVCEEPTIKPFRGTASSTTVSYTMDFARFGLERYSDEAKMLFFRYLIDISFNAEVPVVFNGERYNVSKLSSFVPLYFGTTKNSITYELPTLRIYAADSPNNGQVISFVNCVMTNEGGTHVAPLLKYIAQYLKLNTKKQVTVRQLKPHLSVIVSCHITSPEYNTATKSSLTHPTIKYSIPDEVLKPMLKWTFLTRMFETATIKALAKTDGKKRRHVKTKGTDANEAGGPQSRKCGLFIAEGKSAEAYVHKLKALMDGGPNYVGVLAVRGKGLNVMNATAERIEENKEICELKTMLGLREGMDYTQEKSLNTLRYGYIVIIADSDADGKHIIGLLLNLFYCRYRGLLEKGLVSFYRTPIKRVFKGKTKLAFYTESEYTRWKESTANPASFVHIHYKGLGSSKDKEIEEDYVNRRVVTSIFDEGAEDALELAFDNRLADERKEWIAKYVSRPELEEGEEQRITDFINQELIVFSIESIQRAIPKLMDGLKVSQRKVLFAARSKWPQSSGQSMKVAQLGAYAADKTCYHHDENSLSNVIIGMAQDFVGSNNVPYFTRDGQFGTRMRGGKDAAKPRYPSTKLSPLMRYIIRKEDDQLLEYIVDEGVAVEPVTYYPIVPMLLVNGCNGIGTGWSTFVPNHSLLDVIAYLRDLLHGRQPSPLQPHYEGFKGTIDIRDGRMICRGLFSEEAKRVVVRELPIGLWTIAYKSYLDDLLESKAITDVYNYCSHDAIYFEIEGFKEPTYRSLKLEKRYTMNNMTLLGETGLPATYSSTEQIMHTYFEKRLAMYEKRKQLTLTTIQAEIRYLQDVVRFLELVLSGVIEIRRKKKEVLESLQQHGIDPTVLEMKIHAFTEEEREKTMRKIEEKKTDYADYEKLSIQELWIGELDELEAAYNTQ
jgi:DNA topoisomerase-2